MRSFGRRRSSVRRTTDTTLPFRILGISPTSVEAGSGATLISVTGIDFPGTATIYIDGVAQTTNRISASLLECTVASGVVAVPGFKSIQVIDGIGQQSNTVQWPVSFPVPTLASVAPAFGYLGEGDVPVLGTGTGIYDPGTQGAVDGAPAPSAYGSPTTMTVTVEADFLEAAGDHVISLENPMPGGGTSGTQTFQTRYRTPAITSKSTSLIPIDSGDFDVVLTDSAGGYYDAGGWPDGGTVGTVDDVPVTTVWLSATQVRITVPAAVTAVAGVKVIKVINPTVGGGGGSSAGSNISVSAPTTTALDSVSRVQGFDGLTLTLTGTNLVPTDVVYWGATPLATTYVNATTLTAVITTALLAVAGAVSVTVHTLAGYATNAQTFTVEAWDYSDLGTTLRQRLFGASLVDDGTGRASAWTDTSGGARTPTQSASGQRARIDASVAGLNSQPAPFFDGTRGDFFEYISWLVSGANGVITKTDYTVFVAALAVAALQVNANPTLMGGDVPNILVGVLQATTVDAFDVTTTPTTVPATFNWAPGNAFQQRQIKSGGSLYNRVNRGTEQSAAVGTPSSAFTPNLQYIGKGAAAAGKYTGHIGGILACDTKLNLTHLQQVANLFSFTFGLTYGTLGSLATISSVSPNTATQFDLPFTITVNGSGFTPASLVNIDKYVLATTYVNSTQLTASVTATVLQTYGWKNVTVTNVDAISAPKALTVAQYIPGAGPNLNTISPNAATRFDAPFLMTCTGSNFTPTAVVYEGANALVTIFDSPTQLRATVAAPTLNTSGVKSITVVDSLGTSGVQNLTIANRTPANLTNASAWFKDSVTLNGSNVATWVDKLGSVTKDCTQGTAGAQPFWNTSDSNFNNKTSLDLDGTNDFLSGAAMTSYFTTTDFTVYGVYRFDSLPATGSPSLPFAAAAIVAAASGFFGVTARTGPVMYGYNNDGAYKTAQNTGVLAGVPQWFKFRKAGGNLYLSVSGNAEVSIACGINTITAALQIGSALTGNFMNGQVAEVGTANGAWSSADDVWFPNYLAYEYLL
jgi:hypothetical protein